MLTLSIALAQSTNQVVYKTNIGQVFDSRISLSKRRSVLKILYMKKFINLFEATKIFLKKLIARYTAN